MEKKKHWVCKGAEEKKKKTQRTFLILEKKVVGWTFLTSPRLYYLMNCLIISVLGKKSRTGQSA